MEKCGSPHWNREFSAWPYVFGIIQPLGSRDSVLKVPRWIRDSGSLKFTWVSWNFLASCRLQQVQAKSRWIKLAKLMTGQCRIPLKIKCLFISCFNRANDREDLINDVEEKSYCSSVSMVWWHAYRDHWGFSKQPPSICWPKKLFILTSWGTDKKLMLIEGCWSTSSNLLPNYLGWEISK